MNQTSAVLDDLFDSVSRCLTPEVAGRIVNLRASPQVQQKLDELAEKSTEGTLSDSERSEYETYVRAINFIGILQAKARSVITASASS
ncbi:MAG: hypothetical protein JWM11_4084 [Planctomycetaceae bacterium]|nr:hypothetical protein [Planctomycetaceae bacterium]